jgi:AcrR family transcriptional regulator
MSDDDALPVGALVLSSVARRKERTRQALAETATQLFLERGYDATTVEEIAAAVDVSPRTFFRYFPAKGDIITAVARTSLDDVVAALDRLPPRPPGASVAAAVSEGVATTLARATPATVRSFERLLATSDQLRARWVEECRRNQGRLATTLARCWAADPDELWVQVAASAVIVTVETALAQWSRGGPAADPGPIPTVAAALALLEPLLAPASSAPAGSPARASASALASASAVAAASQGIERGAQADYPGAPGLDGGPAAGRLGDASGA